MKNSWGKWPVSPNPTLHSYQGISILVCNTRRQIGKTREPPTRASLTEKRDLNEARHERRGYTRGSKARRVFQSTFSLSPCPRFPRQECTADIKAGLHRNANTNAACENDAYVHVSKFVDCSAFAEAANRPYINVLYANSLWCINSQQIAFGCSLNVRHTAECCLPRLRDMSTSNVRLIFACRILFAFRCKRGLKLCTIHWCSWCVDCVHHFDARACCARLLGQPMYKPFFLGFFFCFSHTCLRLQAFYPVCPCG